VILASDRISAAEALEWDWSRSDGRLRGAAEAMARQPPIPVRMTKSSVNRLAHALDDLAAHMTADQNVLTGLRDYREGPRRSAKSASEASRTLNCRCERGYAIFRRRS